MPAAPVTTYTIQVDSALSFASPVLNAPVADTFYACLADLPVGNVYWRVKGDDSPWSGVDSFTILDNRIPALIPFTQYLVRGQKPLFMWHSVPSAEAYTIAISGDTSFATSFANVQVSDTIYQISVALPAQKLYWRVKSDLVATWSAIDSLQVYSTDLPYLIAYNGRKVSSRRPSFAWYAVTGATTYRIELSQTVGFANPISMPLSDTSMTPLANLAPGKWFWHVSSDKVAGVFSFSDSLVIDTATSGVRTVHTRAPGAFAVYAAGQGIMQIYVPVRSQGRSTTLTVSDLSGRSILKRTFEAAGSYRIGIPRACGGMLLVAKIACGDFTLVRTIVPVQ